MTVAALVCLLVVVSLVGTMLNSALRSRRELRSERDRRQTELLMEAGAGRAVARLTADPGFHGDTWEVPAADIVGTGSGSVTTEITPDVKEHGRQLRVVAEYSTGRGLSIRRSRTFLITNSQAQSQE